MNNEEANLNRRSVLRLGLIGLVAALSINGATTAIAFSGVQACDGAGGNTCTGTNTCTAAAKNQCGGPGGGPNTCHTNTCTGDGANLCGAAGSNWCRDKNTCTGAGQTNECHSGNTCGDPSTPGESMATLFTSPSNTCDGKGSNTCAGDDGNICHTDNTCKGADPISNECAVGQSNMCLDNTCTPAGNNKST